MTCEKHSPAQILLLATLASPAFGLATFSSLAAGANPAISTPSAQSLDSDSPIEAVGSQVLQLSLGLEASLARGNDRLRG